MSDLFSEVYGCYFEIVSHVLKCAAQGVSKKDIERIANERGFSETAYHILPKLIGGEWNFLERRGDLYFPKFDCALKRPATRLELSWLVALLKDPRMNLFLSSEKRARLAEALEGIEPAFDTEYFVSRDRHRDGDDYTDAAYATRFRAILDACKHSAPLIIEYTGEKTGTSRRIYLPFKLSYSELNDRFRLLCAASDPKTQALARVTLNLGRIVSVEPSDDPIRERSAELRALYAAARQNPPIVLEITQERNALERFLLQFASFDRQTEYDAARDIYTCRVYYDEADETELLIRILSFGPTIRVLSPQSVLDQIKERLRRQLRLMNRDALAVHMAEKSL